MSTTSLHERRRGLARQAIIESPMPLATAWGYLKEAVLGGDDLETVTAVAHGLVDGLEEVGHYAIGRRSGRHARND